VDDRVEGRIKPLDSGYRIVDQFQRADLTASDQLCLSCRVEIANITSSSHMDLLVRILTEVKNA
jgi:hypothetical protein